MARRAVSDNSRVALRIRSSDKAVMLRAAALEQTDLTHFILRTVLREARQVIKAHEQIDLSPRDSLQVLKLLENPPTPNAKLRKAARALAARS